MSDFAVGAQVRWVRAMFAPEYKNAVGTVELVIPSDANAEEFDMYAVKFPFGTRYVYGTQIEAA